LLLLVLAAIAAKDVPFCEVCCSNPKRDEDTNCVLWNCLKGLFELYRKPCF